MATLMKAVSAARCFWDNALNVLVPRICINCDGGREGGGDFLCALCRKDIRFIEPPFCFRCGSPAEISYDYPVEDFECSLCRRTPFAFDRARSLGSYDAVLKKLIHYFKYRGHLGVLTETVPLLERYFGELGETVEGFYVIPIPLHFKKLKERGFDQSFLIGKQVAHVLGLPTAVGLLRRVRDTDPQAKKSRGERHKNIVGAFEVDRPDQVEGKDILLVDDVLTTGATVNEAAKKLKRAGAGRVHVFTLARA